MDIKEEFLKHIKLNYHHTGDARPNERWQVFIGSTFGSDYKEAEQYLQDLIELGYFEEVTTPVGKCLAVTRSGIDSIKRNELP